jgi:hypothetical protein
MLALELAPLNLPAHASALTVALTVRGVEVANASLPVVSQMSASA